MGDHDSSYKQLFSHAEMVRDLLLGFVQEAWVEHLDFATLEKVSGSYITDDLRDREDDVIWRVRWGEAWLYIFVLIEFQSTVDWMMAVRMNVYVMLLYQDLVKSGQVKQGEMLPPVLPMVLYNGKPIWSAAMDVADLIRPVPGGLECFRPHMRYLLIDEVRYEDASLAEMKNLAAALFRLEKSQSPTDIRAVLSSLIDWLKAPGQLSLRRAFTVMLGRVLLPRKALGQVIPELNDLQEVDAMLAETVLEWTKEWEAQGIQKGLEKGRQEEAASMLLRLLSRRFGPLPEEIQSRVTTSAVTEIEMWSDRIFDAESLESVFK
ncbi:putative transposase [Magnetococcus marinus MC-1]|uniref:Putative transposase n=1 Tax=Magnetococcus marinus (strain ATCC BAA-1437 / JCM 17883 / MC-1) TaxID=156889 RepID=A0L953_MAGMM|nr:Rpn family recombination-promoting nuclease/putative transposase [Magnetococcus marinus]ABK44496.1 putative transposase [Magnetococcus marinus MC-1]